MKLPDVIEKGERERVGGGVGVEKRLERAPSPYLVHLHLVPGLQLKGNKKKKKNVGKNKVGKEKKLQDNLFYIHNIFACCYCYAAHATFA